MNSGKVSDQELDTAIDRIVAGLFSVSVTMGSIPIIRCPAGGAAFDIATKLDRKLRDHVLNSKDNLFSSGGSRPSSSYVSTSRPVMIILDRKVDLIPMLSHSWTYQSLVHDVLDMRLNKITVEVPDETGTATKPRAYDLNAHDFFWSRNASAPFPQVAEDIDRELTKYKNDADDVTRRTGVSNLEGPQRFLVRCSTPQSGDNSITGTTRTESYFGHAHEHCHGVTQGHQRSAT